MVAHADVSAAAPPLAAAIALATRVEDHIDVSARQDADVPLEPGGDLPFEDGAVASILLGDAVAALSQRDQVQLLMECRRALAPGAPVALPEPRGAAVHATLARYAALVGLVPLPVTAPPPGTRQRPGWTKRPAGTNPAPLVSIVIPSSNPRYFLECLDSALAQTYRHLEVVVCDDCETGDIAALAATRTGGPVPVRYEKNPQRLRTRLNYEKCLSRARGEYVKFLNDDDVLEPACVERLVDAFLRVPGLVLATSHRHCIDAQSRLRPDMPATRPVVDRDVVVDGVSLANAAIMHGLNFIGEPSTALFRRSDFDRRPDLDGERPFNFNGEEVRGAVDFSMWSRLLVQGNAAFLRDRLSRFRVHREQAQAREDVVARSVAGIRALQRQWIALGLFRATPPHLLRVRPYPPVEDDDAEWQLAPLRSLPAPAVAPEDAVRDWRSTPRHAFDFAA